MKEIEYNGVKYNVVYSEPFFVKVEENGKEFEELVYTCVKKGSELPSQLFLVPVRSK